MTTYDKALFRTTFGIHNVRQHPDKQVKFHDIISSFVTPYNLSIEEVNRGYLRRQGCFYILHIDPILDKLFDEQDEVETIVSFQKRTNGFFAIARIPKDQQLKYQQGEQK